MDGPTRPQKVRPPEIALRGLTRPLGVHPPARPLWRQYWHANCVCQSQRLGSGTSRTFFSASARPIAFLAAVTASDLFAAWPMITTPATDAVHFQTPRSMPSTTVYSMCRYFIVGRAFDVAKTAPFSVPQP